MLWSQLTTSPSRWNKTLNQHRFLKSSKFNFNLRKQVLNGFKHYELYQTFSLQTFIAFRDDRETFESSHCLWRNGSQMTVMDSKMEIHRLIFPRMGCQRIQHVTKLSSCLLNKKTEIWANFNVMSPNNGDSQFSWNLVRPATVYKIFNVGF